MKVKFEELKIKSVAGLQTDSFLDEYYRPKIAIKTSYFYNQLTKSQAQKLMRDLYKHIQNIEEYERMKKTDNKIRKQHNEA